MNFLPKDLENIIVDYKEEMEHKELLEKHRMKFKESLNIIKRLRNTNYRYGTNNRERTITISPFIHKTLGYTYCYCFRVCLICNDIIHSSRMDSLEIGNQCICNSNNPTIPYFN